MTRSSLAATGASLLCVVTAAFGSVSIAFASGPERVAEAAEDPASLPVVARFPADVGDLRRARERVPRDAWKGRNFTEMSAVLTDALVKRGHNVRPCSEWATHELQALQQRLFHEADPSLLEVYEAPGGTSGGDRRGRRFESSEDLDVHWSKLDAATAQAPADLADVRRDGMCHEAVMWWTHHLPVSSQHRLASEGVRIPSLPTERHAALPHHEGVAALAVLNEYSQQVSCQQCHTGKIVAPEWADASLPPPPPEDPAHPGLARKRQCDFQDQPPCGPCEGLGGRRSSDAIADTVPMACEVISGPEVPPLTRGRYPALAVANLTGETRSPVAVKPDGKGHYGKLAGTLFLGWQGEGDDLIMRMRYDFNGLGTEISVQTLKQAHKAEVGATVFASSRPPPPSMSNGLDVALGAGTCVCDASIAGVMHIRSFEATDPLDPLRLPAAQGGAAYLGRVRIQLDGDSKEGSRVAIADHYMKWAFHFLVDADENSPSFGLPLRLYGPYGVRQVFEGWQLGDPSIARPDIWRMPKGCTVKSPQCVVIEGAHSDIEESEELVV